MDWIGDISIEEKTRGLLLSLFAWKEVSFIDEIMGYQVGYLLPIREVQQHLHFMYEDSSGSVEKHASS